MKKLVTQFKKKKKKSLSKKTFLSCYGTRENNQDDHHAAIDIIQFPYNQVQDPEPTLDIASPSSKKILVLDLDETLVHSTIKKKKKSRSYDLKFKLRYEDFLLNFYVDKRPHVDDFLKEVSKIFHVVIFTASTQEYAEVVLDLIDCEKIFIHHRFYRHDCTFFDDIYVKDIRRLDRDMKDVLIIDNSRIAFSFTPESGIPIKSWFGDDNDSELMTLLPLLHELAECNDVREIISERFLNPHN